MSQHAVRSTSVREEEALIQIIDRLRRRFPDVRADEICRLVHSTHMQFERSRIRDFIPILVERLACDNLEKARHPLPATN